MKKYLTSLAERVFITGLLAFISNANLGDSSTWRSGLVGAAAAVAQLIYSIAVKKVGDPESAGVTK